jgi:hypothetical protein
VNTEASLVQMLGAGGFGFLIGWYVYFINRHRKGDVQMSDLVTLIGVVGGGSITALFPQATDLFGAYGIGLFAGFFMYFIVLVVLVRQSPNFTSDWFLDGRRRMPDEGFIIPEGSRPAMDIQFGRRPPDA